MREKDKKEKRKTDTRSPETSELRSFGKTSPVLLGQAEVDHVEQMRLLAAADEEVVRLDVAMDEVLGVKVLDPQAPNATKELIATGVLTARPLGRSPQGKETVLTLPVK